MKRGNAEKVLEGSRARIKTKVKASHAFHLSISMGVIIYTPTKETAEKLISASDDPMYQVKRSGEAGMIIKNIFGFLF